MSRRPNPSALNKLRGNPGHRPINEHEPVFEGGTSPPKWLDSFAKTEWKRLGPKLSVNGMLTPADRAAFTAYVVAFSLARQAHDALDQVDGLSTTTDTGVLKTRPEVDVLLRSLDTCRKFLIEFGLTPASRSKLEIPKDLGKKKTRDMLFGDHDEDQVDEAADNVSKFTPKG